MAEGFQQHRYAFFLWRAVDFAAVPLSPESLQPTFGLSRESQQWDIEDGEFLLIESRIWLQLCILKIERESVGEVGFMSYTHFNLQACIMLMTTKCLELAPALGLSFPLSCNHQYCFSSSASI